MIRFLIQVILSFVFWAFVVWFGLPVLKERAPAVYGRLITIVTDETLGNRFSAAAETVEPTVGQNAKAISDSLSNIEIPEIIVEFPAILGQEEAKNTYSPPNNLTPQDKNAPVIDERGGIPQDAMVALNKDPGYAWGIVVTNSFYYDSKMQRIGIFAGGTVVERKESKIKMNGYVAECFYLINRLWHDETVYLYESDLVMFDVPYQAADKAKRDLLVDYCRTKGRLEELRDRAYKAALRKNPYFEHYKTVNDEYKAFTQKAREAKEEFDHASDVRRSVLMDQLRRYQAEEAPILQRYKAIKKQYDDWKTQNIGDEKAPRTTKTVNMQNLENKLNGMRGAVQELVPGL